MTIGIVLGIIGCVVWIFGIVLSVVCIKEPSETIADRLKVVFVAIIVFGFIGYMLNLGTLFYPQRDIVITHDKPTVTTKTNNITIVYYIQGGKIIASLISSEASFWNSTNIVVRIESGKNWYGGKVDNIYSITTIDD